MRHLNSDDSLGIFDRLNRKSPKDRMLPNQALKVVRGDPYLGLTRDGDKGFEVIETE